MAMMKMTTTTQLMSYDLLSFHSSFCTLLWLWMEFVYFSFLGIRRCCCWSFMNVGFSVDVLWYRDRNDVQVHDVVWLQSISKRVVLILLFSQRLPARQMESIAIRLRVVGVAIGFCFLIVTWRFSCHVGRHLVNGSWLQLFICINNCYCYDRPHCVIGRWRRRWCRWSW